MIYLNHDSKSKTVKSYFSTNRHKEKCEGKNTQLMNWCLMRNAHVYTAFI